MEHPDITCARATGYSTYQQPTGQITEYDREEFWKDNAGTVMLWLIQNYREVLDEYIDTHETHFRRWLG